jgi:hypothetical protein
MTRAFIEQDRGWMRTTEDSAPLRSLTEGMLGSASDGPLLKAALCLLDPGVRDAVRASPLFGSDLTIELYGLANRGTGHPAQQRYPVVRDILFAIDGCAED